MTLVSSGAGEIQTHETRTFTALQDPDLSTFIYFSRFSYSLSLLLALFYLSWSACWVDYDLLVPSRGSRTSPYSSRNTFNSRHAEW